MPVKTETQFGNPASKKPFTIIVEGNIGSGKTTFLNHYQGSDVSILTEPVDKWRDLNGNNLLQLMYTAPFRHSYTFQSYVQLTMTQLHNMKVSTPIKMLERSVYSSRHVFGKNLVQTGKMSPSEFEVLDSWFEFLKSCPSVDLGVDMVIYLRTSPEVAYQRLKARARSEEKLVPIEYLRELHDLHEKWLIENKDSSLYGGAEVVVIDADDDLTEVPHVYSAHKEKIFSVLKENDSISPMKKPKLMPKQPLCDLSNKVAA